MSNGPINQLQPITPLPVVAGAATAIILALLKSKWDIDLSDQTANFVIVVMGLTQHFSPKVN